MIGNPDVATSTATQHISCQVYELEAYTQATSELLKDHKSIDDLVAQWEKDEKRRIAIAEARQWIADTVHENKPETLRTLRLKKGWSQTHLANLLNTSQSHVARIERGTENLTIDTCRRLCNVLEIDMNLLDQVLKQQEAIAQDKASKK